jgi:hypothetical protein
MMGQFGSEQWDCDGQDGYQRLDQVFQRVLSSKHKKKWWECWLRLALFPIKVLLWSVAMVAAAFISCVFVLPGLIIHHSWNKLRQELTGLLQDFKE